jgi:hypothetical protein
VALCAPAWAHRLGWRPQRRLGDLLDTRPVGDPMTEPTAEPDPRCVTCGHPIVHLGGPSWRHKGRPGRGPHAAEPDEASKALVAAQAA